MRPLFALTIALVLATTGCIQNMSDFKERLGADETVEPAAVVETPPTAPTAPAGNTTKELKAPVARLTIFGANGALVYKSTFQAEDPAEIVFVEAESKLSLIAGDSEAIEAGATLTGFAWSLGGKPIEGARQASAELADAGIYALVLTVTDSNGRTDTQTVKLAVAPEPYEVAFELMTGPIVGAEGEGAQTLPFTLAADASKGASVVQKVVIVASPDAGLDAAISVADSEGTQLGDADDAGHTDLDQTETIELGAIALGDYTITVSPFAGADPDGVPIVITVTFLPVIDGLAEGEGHGGHAH